MNSTQQEINLSSYKSLNKEVQKQNNTNVFNNWDIVAEGWYFVCQSSYIKTKQIKHFKVCGKDLVFFRGENKKIFALDAYCSHMGVSLGKGKVIKNSVQCLFHHWRFNSKGECEHIPCQKNIPKNSNLDSYWVIEKFNSIWVHPSKNSPSKLSNFSEIKDNQELLVNFGKSYNRSCHHHVTMINGLDPQHLKTIHSINIEMDVDIKEDDNIKIIDFTLKGKNENKTFLQKLVRFLFGKTYSYSMRYDHANNGFLTLMKDVYFYNKKWAPLHMIFAYRPINKGKTLVQPIYVTKNRKGIFGKLFSHILIYATKLAFFYLKDEDGEIYDNIRFNHKNLLPIDEPVATYINYTNKLRKSSWKLS